MLREGPVAPGDALALVERPELARANDVMHFVLTAELAAVPPLSANWKAALRNRAEKQIQPDISKRLEGA